MFPLDIEQTYIPDPTVVAAHNDMFRRSLCLGIAPQIVLAGRAVTTHALALEGDDFIKECVRETGNFDTFAPDNDPNGYHDFGAFDVEGKRVFFKIDMFERGSHMRWGAENPDDPAQTERLLTIMLASDW